MNNNEEFEIEKVKHEMLYAITQLNSYIVILPAYIEQYSDFEPIAHASLIVDNIRQQVNILMKNSDKIF